ncbi:zinc finger CCCH domain-containing protein 62-like [Pyrus x bretschneideri]|uniref:zinc finger CCCH domain-containing protein 62-like n=1 Tax=Pyrus x bretschneideri TaxID=225117 RepID=UPI00202E8B8C|nr:zinc finger CCCH domain-containing protein 62-like [Pyrus x bretschneideri]
MVLGKKTVAGKESYSADKQQPTFTVEVLWIRGIKKLCPLFPLLVKGRNLYKLRTFRQSWSEEAERSQVLAEKHRRGEAARRVRAMKKSRKLTENRGVKCTEKITFYQTKPN